MSREEYIKSLISKKGMTIKSFASSIDMPYSTLLSMLNGSIGGAAVDNVIKICKGLEITISDLQSCADSEYQKHEIVLSPHEKALVYAYRANTNMQSAVDKLLGVEEGPAIAGDMKETIKQCSKSFSKDTVIK